MKFSPISIPRCYHWVSAVGMIWSSAQFPFLAVIIGSVQLVWYEVQPHFHSSLLSLGQCSWYDMKFSPISIPCCYHWVSAVGMIWSWQHFITRLYFFNTICKGSRPHSLFCILSPPPPPNQRTWENTLFGIITYIQLEDPCNNVVVMGTDNRTHFSYYIMFIQLTLRPACGSAFPEQGTIPGYDTNTCFFTTVNELHNLLFYESINGYNRIYYTSTRLLFYESINAYPSIICLVCQ